MHSLVRNVAPSMRRLPRAAMLCAAVCTLLLQAACGGGDATGTGGGDGRVATVEVSQQSVTLGVGSTLALQALVRDAAGNAITNRPVVWTSGDETIATVSAAGVVTAVRTGNVQIAATVEGRSAVTTLTVAPRAVASVQVTPSDPRLLVGGSIKLSAQTLDENGAALAGRRVEWRSSDARVAAVDSTGMVIGVAPGVATITVTSESRSISIGVSVSLVPVARIDVTPVAGTVVVGQSTQLTAVLRDSVGGLLGERMVSWGTSDVAIATVSSSGLVQGVAPGSATITVASAGKTTDVRITVQPRPVGSIIVSPSQASVVIGGSVQLTTQLTDANGNLLTGRAVQFVSSNAAVATVSASGLVTGVAAGATTLTVTSEGKTSTVNVQVSPVPVASVRLDPATSDLTIGGTVRLSATALDGDGRTLTGRATSWLSGATNVATVSADGLVTAVGPGTAIVLATVEGRSASATITVRSIPVGKVTVTPSEATVIVGDGLDLSAEARDASGVLLSGRPILWTSSNDALAVVSSTGRVRAVSPGTVEIRGSVDGVSGAAAITVIEEPVLRVSVSPASLTLVTGTSAQLTAIPLGRNDLPLTGRSAVFASSNSANATVSSTGLVTGIRAGDATITVTVDGRSADVAVRVVPPPVASVTITLGSASLTVGGSTQASVVVRDAANAVLTGRAVSFTSSSPLVATVGADGTVNALLPGTTTITATSEGKSASASLTVVALPPTPVATVTVSLNPSSLIVGGTAQATAVTRSSTGTTLTGRVVSWASSNTAVATVSSSGEVTAVSAGSATITATSEGKSGSAGITVTAPPPAPVATVSVSLGASTVIAGVGTQATAVLRAADNSTLTGRTVTWSSSDATIATVSGTGAVSTLRAGSVTITATSEGKSGSAGLTVTAPPPAAVATVSVSLGASSIAVGAGTSATAVTRDANGAVLTGRTVTWSSSNTAVATVNSSGAVTAVGVGSASITATSEGKTGSAGITVTAPPPAPVNTVSVVLSRSTIFTGTGAEATATLRDADGAVVIGRNITWTSSAPSIASVTSSGAIVGLLPGSATITATSEGKSGSATISVQLIPVSRVEVSPSSATVESKGPMGGRQVQLSATLYDASNNVVTGRTVTWSTSSSVASVSSGGLVTGLRSGTVTITATIEGKSDTAVITVRN